ncbi:hypothetical protein [Sulfurisphaera ohwakuensis]|uniref:Uncharacterized protein n=1 Tax=Sulfurisphaera ohwakuensis TaxID=69656 RepID=A0A650CEG7_SULOH|nr:hypothetical protein [Sulfurisphaera ohwakuensis]MBB5253138.1 hypothetical protein [Sulfurisphaera ohwakuensis]QGR15947.1 hypothetical protein D1869_01155 [Sulfurisphaera ohwakuensis]
MSIELKQLVIPSVTVEVTKDHVYGFIPKIFSEVIEKGRKYYVYAKVGDSIIPIGFKTFYSVNKNGTLAIGLPKNLLDWSQVKKITLIVQLS